MDKFLESRRLAYLFLCICGLFFIYSIVNYYGANDNYAGDGLRHYLVSRWCWKHPDLLLYHWGKPFFTLITSPFSQIGHKGIQLFNLIVSLAGACLLFEISRYYGIKNSALIILMVFFMPLYFAVINTGLTEPLFFFMIAGSAYLLLREKYLWSSIIVSFLPFVRSEGNLIIALFLIVLLLRRKIRYIPLLSAGTIVYSIIGGFYYKDFYWVFTKNPYNGANSKIYGHGELLFFLKAYDFILGIPLTILFLTGLLFYIWKGNKGNFLKRLKKYDIEIFVLLGSPVIYFVAHSIFWWKGLFNSLGLVRAIAGAVPLATVACLRGLNLIEDFILKEKKLKVVVLIMVMGYIVYYPFQEKYFPPKLGKEDEVATAALDWFKNCPYKNNLVYYLNPYIAEQLKRDPFNPKEVRELWGLSYTIRDYGYGAIPDSTVVFWDSHFGPNEAHIRLDSIMADPHFELLKVFKPEVAFTTLGGNDFGIYLFLKIQPKKISVVSSEISFDLEEISGLQNANTITDKEFHSGKKSSELNDKNEYSIMYQVPVNALDTIGTINKIIYSFYIKTKNNNLDNAKVVLSITDKNKTLEWISQNLMSSENETGIWVNKYVEFNINPQAYSGNNPVLKLYIWNSKRKNSLWMM